MRLMVSLNCGADYYQEAHIEGSDLVDLTRLLARVEELRLDEQMLRWVIESDDGSELHEVSAIHSQIMGSIIKARLAEAMGEGRE